MDAKHWTGDEPDPHPEGRPDPPEPPQICAECGKDAFYPVSNPSFGVFCSHACLDLAEAKFVTFMHRPKASGE